MKATTKRIIYSLIITLLVFIAGLMVFIHQINLNDYKQKIEKTFFKKTGLHLAINGKIKWWLFPNAEITIHDVDITNEKQKLFTIQSATANIGLVPLFSKTIQINKIILKDMYLNIIKQTDGRFNFYPNTVKAETSQSESISGTDRTTPKNHNTFSITVDSIQKIFFDNVDLFYQDVKEGQNFSVKNASLNLFYSARDNEFPLQMSATINSKQPAVKMDVKLQGVGAVDFKQQKYALNDINLVIKPNNVTGIKNNFTVSGKLGVENEKLLFNLNGSQLNVRNFIPVVHEENNASASESATGSSVTTEKSIEKIAPVIIPAALIRTLNMEGTLRLDSLIYDAWTFDHPELTVKAANGITEISPLKTGFSEGIMIATIKLNAQQTLPDIAVNASAKGIEIEKLLQNTSLEGKAYADIRLLTQGETLNDLIKKLNGEVSFHINQGKFNAVNINKLVCDMIAKVNQKGTGTQEWAQGTPFELLQGKWNINDGVASNNDLTAKLLSMDLHGDGWINLIDRTIDYHLGLTITGDSIDNNSACKINPRYADITWPIKCAGKLGETKNLFSIDSERFGLLLQKILKQEAEYHLKKKLQQHFKGFFK
ncbi:MAG: AsmA family protein [Endozoicomonadaceae bacterium]|nr:AsmA family protein [Endozoicomonadaceae bacterium]